jgi:hypothetical protein
MDWIKSKTTIFSLIAAGAGFVVFSPEIFAHQPVIVALAKYVMVGGLAGLGITARDNSTSDEQAGAGKE